MQTGFSSVVERQRWMSGLAIGSGLLMLLLSVSNTAVAQLPVWVPHGPAPNTRGQVENIKNGEIVGAINAVAPHPKDANVVYVGAVNGGIWKTNNAMAGSPTWEPQTDGQKSLSIGALEFDPTDVKNLTLVAGTGLFSSLGDGGSRAGLLRTTDGGKNWTALDGGGTLTGLNVAGVAPRGATICIAVNAADNRANVGIWRSTNTGATWDKISGGKKTELPAGPTFDLAGDPTNCNRLFTNGGLNGLYRSNDAGATWAKVSDKAMNALIANADNVEIAVGAHDTVYVAVVSSGELAGVFRSGNNGANWTKMDLPTTAEGGIHPGGQGALHLSIAADPSNANIVYVGGDRQDGPFPSPNSIGARDYSGRLFRGDAAKPQGSQWVHLTHSNKLGAAGGGTANGSAPHADSRDMKIAANGTLIEVSDGGIYRRTNPQTNKGDWFSMNGDLQTTELHAVAWDANSKIVIGGAQDTGTPQQQLPAGKQWQSVSTADGGVVAVDASSSPGLSTRYSSNQFLSGFRRRVYNAANVFQSQIFPPLTVLNGGSALVPEFYTPIKLNAVSPTRLIIGARNSVYESLDQGDTITEIGPTIAVNAFVGNPIAYGSAKNPDILYVGSGVRVFVRTQASPAPLNNSDAYPGGRVRGIAIDPADPQIAYVIDAANVYRTTDAGASWTDITEKLPSLAGGRLRSVAYSTSDTAGAVVVGTDTGVFAAPGPLFTKWSQFGTGLPRTPILSLEYDAADKILLAGTLGRGAWTAAFNAAPGDFKEPKKDPKESEKMVDFQLRPGVIIDPDLGHVYVMNPKGGVDAIRLGDGKGIWSTQVAAKPLAVVGDRLISQAEATTKENTLKIVGLKRATGEQVVTGTMDLPAGVKPLVDQTPKSEFVAHATPSNSEALVVWQYLERPIRGLPPGVEEKLQLKGDIPAPKVVPAAVPKTKGGGFRMNLTTGVTAPLAAKDVPIVPKVSHAEVPKAERVVGPGTQLLSVDGRHILTSKRTADDRVWEKFVLTVYARDTRKPLGEFKSHLSVVPFFVSAFRIIYVTEPYTRRTQTGLIEEPLKIRAVDLRSGEELWSRQIRDTTYRGPLPP